MRNLTDKLVVAKWHVNLGYSTLGTLGIGLVISKTLQEILLPYYTIPLIILFPAGVIVLWLTGFLYEKLGFYSKEAEYSTELNTYFNKKFKKD